MKEFSFKALRAKHVFLILTGITAALGFMAGDSIYLDLGRPLAGIFFGLFLITAVWEKESDLLDEQLGTPTIEVRRNAAEDIAEMELGLEQAHSV